MDGRADPWCIKAYPGGGIGAFVKHLSNFSRLGLEEPEDSEKPADIDSDVTSSDEYSDTSSEETTNSSYYEEDEEGEEDDDEAAATPAPEEEEDPSDEDGDPEPYNPMGPGRYCACVDFYFLKEGEVT